MKISIILLCVYLSIAQNYAISDDWGYDGPNGPSQWCKVSESCCGKQQSPIDIVTANVREQKVHFRKVSSFDKPLTFVAENNGHKVLYELKDKSQAPKLEGVKGNYTLEHVHFHWGSPDNSIGSEHTIDGKASRMEFHLEYYKSSLNSMKDAMNSDSPYSVAVLGFLVEEKTDQKTSNDPAKYASLVSALSSVKYKGQTTDVKDVIVQDLLPEDFINKPFYSYDGSTTTPPCKQGVFRVVAKDKIYLTKDQISKFFDLYTTEESEKPPKPMWNNFRPVQPLNGRTVDYSIVEAVG